MAANEFPYVITSNQFVQKLKEEGEKTESEKKGAEKILKLKINGKDLKKDKSYKVAMSSDLGAGAFGYWKIWEPKDFKKTDITMEKAILDYLEKDPIKNFFLKRIIVGE